jgi:hypothetical protein
MLDRLYVEKANELFDFALEKVCSIQQSKFDLI